MNTDTTTQLFQTEPSPSGDFSFSLTGNNRQGIVQQTGWREADPMTEKRKERVIRMLQRPDVTQVGIDSEGNLFHVMEDGRIYRNKF